MTAEMYLKYTAVIFTIIGLTLLVLLFFYILKNFSVNKNINNNITASTFQKTMEDLDRIIQRKCSIAYRRALEPLVNKSLKNKPLINDKIVNELTIQITKEILEEMSDSYRKKLEDIYKEDILNDVILEQVYNTITEMSMAINKKSINKMNLITRFKNMTKNDFD